MGNLVAQDPSIVLPGEPDAPSTYWLAALDVFETGENLPSRVGGNNLDTPEDWRMAIVWGRTLVCLADEKVTHNMKMAKAQAEASSASQTDYCYYPSGSPFSPIGRAEDHQAQAARSSRSSLPPHTPSPAPRQLFDMGHHAPLLHPP